MLTIPLNMTGRGVHNVGSWSSCGCDDSTRNLSVLCVHPTGVSSDNDGNGRT